jgi:hypothetical protein
MADSESCHEEGDDWVVALVGEEDAVLRARQVRLSPRISDSSGSLSVRSRRTLSSDSMRTFDSRLDDSDVDHSDEDLEYLPAGPSDMNPEFEKFLSRIAKLKEREKRLRTKAKEKLHRLCTNHEEERDGWKASLVELERVKRDRDRLLQDQATERSRMKESNEAAKQQQQDLGKIRRSQDLNNTCKSSRGTHGAKDSLDWQRKIESLQQRTLSMDAIKHRQFLTNEDDPLTSLSRLLLGFLHATIAEQKQVSLHIASASTEFSVGSQTVLSSSIEKKWNKCKELLGAAFQSSQHSTAIDQSLSEIHEQCESQLKALRRLKKDHQRQLEYFNKINTLQVEPQVINTQDAADADQKIQDLKWQLEQKEAAYKDVQERFAVHDTEMVSLRIECNAAVESNHTSLQKLEKLKSEQEEKVQALSYQLEESNQFWHHYESQFKALQVETEELRATRTSTQNVHDQALVEIENLKSQLAEKDLRLSVIQNEKMEQEKKIGTMQTEITTLKTNLEESQQTSSVQLDEIRNTLHLRRKESSSLRADLRRMKDDFEKRDDILTKMKEFKRRSFEMHQNLTSLQEIKDHTFQQHEKEVKELRGEITGWKVKYDEIFCQNTAMERERQLRTSRIEEQEGEINQLKMLHAQDSQDIQCANERIKDVEFSLREKEALGLKLQNDLTSLQEKHTLEVAGLQTLIEALQVSCKNLEATETETIRREEEKRIARDECKDSELAEIAASFARLQVDYLGIQSNYTSLKEEVAAIHTERTELMRENDTCKEKIINLQAEVLAANKLVEESESGNIMKENKVLQLALEKIASENHNELIELGNKNLELNEENEKHKNKIEALENEVLDRSLRAAERAAGTPIGSLDQSNCSKYEYDWTDIGDFVEALNESFSVGDVEQRSSIEILQEKFRSLQSSTQQRYAYFMETNRRQKVSIDSMFDDLVFARNLVKKLKQRVTELQTIMEGGSTGAEPSQMQIVLTVDDSLIVNGPSPGREPMQADMLQSIVVKQGTQKQRQINGTFNRFFRGGTTRQPSNEPDASSLDADEIFLLEERCQHLEGENKTLKSSMVRLQSQFKEEVYKNRKTVEELQLTNDAVLLKNMTLSEAIASERNKPVENFKGDEDQAVIPVDEEPSSASQRDRTRIAKV